MNSDSAPARTVRARRLAWLAILAAGLAGCSSAPPPASRPTGAAASSLAAGASAADSTARADAAPRTEPKPQRPSAAIAILQGPQLTPAEIARFVAGLAAAPMEHRVRMADTIWKCGLADPLLPPSLWVYVQRLGGRDMDDGILSEMGFGFHLAYTHFAPPVVFHFVEELEHGTAYHKFELDWFLQYVTLRFDPVESGSFRNPAWVSKRANAWLAWIAENGHRSRLEWAMAALEQRPEVEPARVYQVLEDVTGLEPFPTKVDAQDPADVARRREHWLAWWKQNRDLVYWFEEEDGPVLQGFPAWWNSDAGKAAREQGLFRVDAEARSAGMSTGEFRKIHSWR